MSLSQHVKGLVRVWFDGGPRKEYDNGRKYCGKSLPKRLIVEGTVVVS